MSYPATRLGTTITIFLLASCQSSSSTSSIPPEQPQPEAAVTPETINGLACELSAEPAQKLADGLAMTLRVRNSEADARRFCDYHTPFEGIRNDILRIEDSQGALLPYHGIMAKRAPPGPEDYLAVEPNGVREVTFQVTDEYPLAAGSYTVTFQGHSSNKLPDSNPVKVTLK